MVHMGKDTWTTHTHTHTHTHTKPSLGAVGREAYRAPITLKRKHTNHLGGVKVQSALNARGNSREDDPSISFESW
jgi:hypothetical protein